MGGIGKSELAYVVADRVKDTFTDAQIVVELRGASNPLTPEQALQTIIRAFGCNAKLPDDLTQLQGSYRSVLMASVYLSWPTMPKARRRSALCYRRQDVLYWSRVVIVLVFRECWLLT